jgi:hypothetical protein
MKYGAIVPNVEGIVGQNGMSDIRCDLANGT